MVQRSLPRPSPLQQAAEALKRGETAQVYFGNSIQYLMFVIWRLERLTDGTVEFSFDPGGTEQHTITVWLKGEGDGS